jgi:hypothetical protein
MMMKNVLNSAMSLLMVIFFITFGESSLPAQNPIYRPAELNEPLFEANKVLDSLIKTPLRNSSLTWDVYVARNGAVSFKDKNANEKHKTLDFMQGLWVVDWDQNSGMLHVFETESFRRNELINPVDMGWVHYSDLLIWNQCLIKDHVTKLEIKGLIINQAEFFVGLDPDAVDFGEVYFYNDPELSEKTERYSSMYQHYFIYKTYYDENQKEVSYLLGSLSKLPALNMGYTETAQDVILGWVPASRTVVWDTRVAIEPNDYTPAIDEMINKETPPVIFASENSAIEYFENGIIDLNDVLFMHNHETAGELLGTWMRPPQLFIVSHKNSLLHVGTTGPVTDLTLKNILIEREEFDNIRSGSEILDRNLRQVNIVFVIDGTSSMQPYFKPVAEIIEQAMGDIEAMHQRNTFRLGAVVYRDHAELVSNRLVEVYNLEAFDPEEPENHGLIGFLNGIDAQDLHDQDPPEAVYFGLKTALTRILPAAREPRTNIVIMIGDAGDHAQNPYTRIDQKLLSQMLAEKGCGFLVFQVHHRNDHSTYNEFPVQMKEIIMQTATDLFDLNAHLAEVAADAGIEYDKPEFTEIESNVYRLDNYPLGATIVKAEPGTFADPYVLKSRIIKQLEASQNYLQEQINIREKFIRGGTEPSELITENFVDYTNSMGPGFINQLRMLGVEPELFDILASERVQVFQEGYAPMRLATGSHALFKRVLFISEQDLVPLMESFRKLVNALNAGDARLKLQDAWKEIFQSYVVELPPDWDDMKFSAIRNHIWGVENPNSVLSTFSYKQISETRLITDEIINSYKMEMQRGYVTLGRIMGNTVETTKYSFTYNNVRYFWIPEEFIP